ncbi:MAG: hypothetical protein ABTQ34_00965 [Bdellovibrionales bacterium]
MSILSNIAELFKKNRKIAENGGRESPIIVNYVWMKKNEDDPIHIPSKLFYWLQKNATAYPEVKFHLWLEDMRACEPYEFPAGSLRSLDSLQEFQNPIPARQDSILLEKDPKTFWIRTDIARLLAVRQTLEENPDATVVYSDFDVPDILVRSPEFTNRINKYGVVLASPLDAVFKDKPNPDSQTSAGHSKEKALVDREFENGYFAFNSSMKGLLNRILRESMNHVSNIVYDEKRASHVVCETDLAFREMGAKPAKITQIGRSNIYWMMTRALDDWFGKGCWDQRCGGFRVQPRSGYQPPERTATPKAARPQAIPRMSEELAL